MKNSPNHRGVGATCSARIERERAVASQHHTVRTKDLLDVVEHRFARVKDDVHDDIGRALKEVRDEKLLAALECRKNPTATIDFVGADTCRAVVHVPTDDQQELTCERSCAH